MKNVIASTAAKPTYRLWSAPKSIMPGLKLQQAWDTVHYDGERQWIETEWRDMPIERD